MIRPAPPEQKKQPNGIVELLDPPNRATAETHYSMRGVGPTAEERYAHFKNDQRLSREAYYQIDFNPQAEADVRRLAMLEWHIWQNKSGSE